MIFGSVCSGIEAASVAWHPLGWRAAWLAEIEPFPKALLAHHYPDVPNLGDMTTIAARVASGEVAAPDILVGGTPCQAFSVAGLRGGFSDARGQLTLSYVELANGIDAARSARGEQPAILAWENVPGVLNHKDNPFGCFLGALAGEDCELKPPGKRWPNAGCVFGPQRTVAWRVLDAQYFGVAQRRRRVFVVASARDGFDPAAVLFEFEGVRRDTPPSREAGQGFAADASPSLTRSGRGVARPGETRGQDPVVAVPAEGCWWDGGQVSQTLDAVLSKGQTMPEKNRFPAVLQPTIAFDTTQITHPENRSNPQPGAPCHPLSAGAHPPAIAFDSRQDPVSSEHVAGALGSSSPQAQAVCEIVGAMSASGATENKHGFGWGQQDWENGYCQPHGMSVRRLTPRECERLQGFPDDYTHVPVKVKRLKPEGAGPCVKQTVTATVVSKKGVHYVATNHCLTPQATCPRAGMPTGVGYELCRDVCHQPAHAEPNAIKLAGKHARGGTLYLQGHTYACEPCKAAAAAAGIVEIVFGKPPGNAADGPRYKALGNSMAVPCMAWIGRRIAAELARGAPA